MMKTPDKEVAKPPRKRAARAKRVARSRAAAPDSGAPMSAVGAVGEDTVIGSL